MPPTEARMLETVNTPDGSIISDDGRVLFFSTERFVRDICLGDCCFICGCSPSDRAFTREHILPKWVLRRFDLFSKAITLPNGTALQYGQYTVPCCTDCNALMGRTIEEPVREVITGGYRSLVDHLKERGPLLFFTWMALIFVKTHLKDRRLRMNRDTRAGDDSIAKDYDWAALHHVHCIARSFFTGCRVNAEAHGSMMFLSAKTRPHFERFDFKDVHHARSVLVRCDDVAMVAVLDDGCGAWSIFQDVCAKFRGSMSPIQLREILGHLSYLRLHLRDGARFWTEFDPVEGLSIVGATPPHAELDGRESPTLGELVYGCCEDVLSSFPNSNIAETKAGAREGRWTSLWTASGDFDQESMELLT